MAMSIRENSDMISITVRENSNGQMEIGIWETSSMVTGKAMAPTITTIKISIKDSGRTIKEKDMGYSDSVMET